MSYANIDTCPKVWIGCLACYSDGQLVGDWYDCGDLHLYDDDGIMEDIHGGDTCHDELWCFDTDNLPVRGEIDVMQAREIGEKFRYFGDKDQWLLACLWADETGGDLDDFSDKYRGTADTFRDWAIEQADMEIECLIPETTRAWVEHHFDYDRYARDLQGDYYVIRFDMQAHIFLSH